MKSVACMTEDIRGLSLSIQEVEVVIFLPKSVFLATSSSNSAPCRAGVSTGPRQGLCTEELSKHSLHTCTPLKMKITCQEKLCQDFTIHSELGFLLLQEPSCFRNIQSHALKPFRLMDQLYHILLEIHSILACIPTLLKLITR